MENTQVTTIARHGDILLKKTNQLFGKKSKTKTVAEGEVTGHHHTFFGDAVCYVDDAGEVKSVEVLSVTPLRHQEHKEIQFAPAKYKVYRKFEFDPFRKIIEKVRD